MGMWAYIYQTNITKFDIFKRENGGKPLLYQISKKNSGQFHLKKSFSPQNYPSCVSTAVAKEKSILQTDNPFLFKEAKEI